ncbi:MAG: hypothetical protein AAF213_08660 [Pseudomonadota bacterium]
MSQDKTTAGQALPGTARGKSRDVAHDTARAGSRDDDDRFVDLTALMGDGPDEAGGQGLTAWRARRVASMVAQAVTDQYGPHAQIAQIDLYESGLMVRISDDQGRSLPSFQGFDDGDFAGERFDRDKPMGPQGSSLLVTPGTPTRVILHEDGAAISHDMTRDDGDTVRFADMTTALEESLQRPEGAHLSRAAVSMVSALAQERFQADTKRYGATTPASTGSSGPGMAPGLPPGLRH